MKEIKKIEILPIAKILGIMGLIVGVLIDLVLIIAGLIQGTSISELFASPVLMITPILSYGIIWFLAGLLFGWVYNWLAKKMGGIKLELN